MCDSCEAAGEAWLELEDRYHTEILTPGQKGALRREIRKAKVEYERLRRWNHGKPRDDETAEGFRMELTE